MRSQGSLIGKNNSAATGQGIWNLNAFFDQPPRNNAGKWGADRPDPEYQRSDGIWTLDEITRLGRDNKWNSTVLNQFSLEVAVIAGGGGGGTTSPTAGGGGAGGMLISTETATVGTTYSATIGLGGSAGSNGSNSTLSVWSLTAIGGGRGQNHPNSTGNSGGSGGGGSYGTTGAGTAEQGNNAGIGYSGNPLTYGGGGGKGGVGGNGQNSYSGTGGGNGGAGHEWPSGSGDYYAGGGGARAGGSGGSGGGGAAGSSGTANTGGGGGGGGGGGSGIVILKIRASQYLGSSTGSPTVEDFNDGSTDFKLVKFTGNGSYTA